MDATETPHRDWRLTGMIDASDLTTDQFAALVAITETIRLRKPILNTDEWGILVNEFGYLLDGLVKGRAAYGPLDLKTDKRDFSKEFGEEVRDALNYLFMDRARGGNP